jgi:ABC-type sugar transport system permease subunit
MAKRRIAFYLMTIPALLLFFAFHTYPALQGIFYAFTNWDGFSESYNFVGFKNYREPVSGRQCQATAYCVHVQIRDCRDDIDQYAQSASLPWG